jgi:hypothetical protein
MEWHQGDPLLLEEMDGRCSGQKDTCVPKSAEDHDLGRKEAIIDSQEGVPWYLWPLHLPLR